MKIVINEAESNEYLIKNGWVYNPDQGYHFRNAQGVEEHVMARHILHALKATDGSSFDLVNNDDSAHIHVAMGVGIELDGWECQDERRDALMLTANILLHLCKM